MLTFTSLTKQQLHIHSKFSFPTILLHSITKLKIHIKLSKSVLNQIHVHYPHEINYALFFYPFHALFSYIFVQYVFADNKQSQYVFADNKQ